MIQYSSINDAWGNKEIYKKNTINNIDGFTNKPLNNLKQINTFIQPKPQEVETFVQVPVPQQPKVETFIPVLEQKIEKILPVLEEKIQNNEHFYNIPATSTMRTSCGFAEHLKNCEYCRSSLSEYFDSDNSNSVSTINIFGLKINITKDVLKFIFVIIIIIIFIIILSTINVSLKETKMNMKYYIVPQGPNVAMHNFPFYH
jgi:hypothetical protein